MQKEKEVAGIDATEERVTTDRCEAAPQRSYYYDDAHGYQEYDPNEDMEIADDTAEADA